MIDKLELNLPKEFVDNYLSKLPKMYEKDILKDLLSNDCDVDLTEKSVNNFYTYMNGGTPPKEIVWLDHPFQLRDYMDGSISLFSSYFNINWVYFFETFYDAIINETDCDPKKLADYENHRKYSKDVINIFINVFGVSEESIDGLEYGRIYLIRKPTLLKTVGDSLHSYCGPAFGFEGSDELLGYFINNVKFKDEKLYYQTIVTGLSRPHSDINDKLTEDEIEIFNKRLKQFEDKIGEKIEPFNVEKFLRDEYTSNTEVKSKILQCIGWDFVMSKAKILNEELVVINGTALDGKETMYQLFEIDLGLEHDEIPSRFVKVTCWSTGREYVLSVDPRSKQCETAMGAVAWTCKKPDGTRCTEDEYRKISIET